MKGKTYCGVVVQWELFWPLKHIKNVGLWVSLRKTNSILSVLIIYKLKHFENYLKIVCTFKMMNPGFCVYYSEMHIRNTENLTYVYVTLTYRYQPESHSVKYTGKHIYPKRGLQYIVHVQTGIEQRCRIRATLWRTSLLCLCTGLWCSSLNRACMWLAWVTLWRRTYHFNRNLGILIFTHKARGREGQVWWGELGKKLQVVLIRARLDVDTLT